MPADAQEDPLLSEHLFGRGPRLKVFVSSQMRRRVLDAERVAAVDAIESTQLASAWHWERDAHAGPYCAREVCLGHARTSDGLVLIVGRRLTPLTREEYEAASANGVPRYVFLKQGIGREAATRRFVETEQRREVVTKGFVNVSELQTQIKEALLHYWVQAVRRENLRRRSGRNPKARKRR
jgi:hypothetical protein